ncbi:MAG: Crp/Fnr family transcriptional regulator [Erythrobacter sp.]
MRADDWDEREIETYPRSGRFLANRARRDMAERHKRILEDAIEEVETIARPTRVLARGREYNHSTMLIEGYVMRSIDGPTRRHGLSFHVPGDFVDLHCFALKRLDHNLDTVGPVTLGYVRHERLQQIIADEPELARLLWFATLVDAAIHREWIMKLEQLTVPRRLAHLFAENWYRLRLVGLGDERGFDTPLTQANLAEMVGATTIHVNRAIKELRQEELVGFARGRIDIPDLQRLQQYAEFNPDYLYGAAAFAPFRSGVAGNGGGEGGGDVLTP